MERLTRRLEVSLRPVTLELEDLRRVLVIASSLGDALVIDAGDMRFSTLEELLQNTYDKSVKKIRVASAPRGDACLHVSIGPTGPYIAVYEIDLTAQDVFNRLKDFLASKQINERWWLRYGLPFTMACAVLLMLLMLYLPATEHFARNPDLVSYVKIYSLIGVVTVLLLGGASQLHLMNRPQTSEIWLIERPEAPGKWEKWNKYIDIKGIVTKALCFLGGGLLMWLYMKHSGLIWALLLREPRH